MGTSPIEVVKTTGHVSIHLRTVPQICILDVLEGSLSVTQYNVKKLFRPLGKLIKIWGKLDVYGENVNVKALFGLDQMYENL